VYRVEIGSVRPDPRVALRSSPATDAGEVEGLIGRLRRLDARRSSGPWTRRTLEIIAAHPEVRAGRLCQLAAQEREAFKLDVRKLKALGLTESLEVGYRISPRGAALLAALRAQTSAAAGANDSTAGAGHARAHPLGRRLLRRRGRLYLAYPLREPFWQRPLR
jgi:hypothetical protein